MSRRVYIDGKVVTDMPTRRQLDQAQVVEALDSDGQWVKIKDRFGPVSERGKELAKEILK